MWLIFHGKNAGKLVSSEIEAMELTYTTDLFGEGYAWISKNPAPSISGIQDLIELPREWRIFAEGFRAAEAILGETNNEA